MSDKVSKKAAIRTPFKDAIAKPHGGLASPAPAVQKKGK